MDKLVIRDYKEKHGEWIFPVKKWFSVAHGDKKLRRFIYQTQEKRLPFLAKLINVDDFRQFHVWFGFFYRFEPHL